MLLFSSDLAHYEPLDKSSLLYIYAMKMNLIFLVAVSTLLSCEPPKKLSENALGGLWELHIMELQDSETGKWNEWRDGMQGYLLYDDIENMSLHLMKKGYQDTDLRFPNFIDTISLEAMKYLTGSYVYFGKYTIDQENGIVQHERISHSNPGEWGKIVQRRFSFSGDTLVLQPVEQSNSGLRLKWIRESNRN